MIEPLRNWLGMGATIPARIQPGSIDHVPFPTVVPCLGASLALLDQARPSRRGALSHYHLPPFLSSLHFTHEDRHMYVGSTSVAGAIE